MYKLLRLGLQSSFAHYSYKLGCWNRPEYGKLFVFDTIENAKLYWAKRPPDIDYVLYSCSVINPKRADRIAASALDFCVFWRGHNYLPTMKAPRGTFFVDGVWLNKCISC